MSYIITDDRKEQSPTERIAYATAAFILTLVIVAGLIYSIATPDHLTGKPNVEAK